MATHSSILAWEIPWTEAPRRLQSMGLGRVRYDWATELNWTEYKELYNELCILISLFLKSIYVFVYMSYLFLVAWVFVAASRLSLAAESGRCSLLWCAGFSRQWLLLLQSTGSRHVGFRSCSTWAQWLRHMDLIALWNVGSSRVRDWTFVPWIIKQILIHYAIRKCLLFAFL